MKQQDRIKLIIEEIAIRLDNSMLAASCTAANDKLSLVLHNGSVLVLTPEYLVDAEDYKD